MDREGPTAGMRYPVPRSIRTDRTTPRLIAVLAICLSAAVWARAYPVLKQSETTAIVLFDQLIPSGDSSWLVTSDGRCVGYVDITLTDGTRLLWEGAVRALLDGDAGEPVKIQGQANFTAYRWAESVNLLIAGENAAFQLDAHEREIRTMQVAVTGAGGRHARRFPRPQPLLLVPKDSTNFAITLPALAQRTLYEGFPLPGPFPWAGLRLERGDEQSVGGCAAELKHAVPLDLRIFWAELRSSVARRV